MGKIDKGRLDISPYQSNQSGAGRAGGFGDRRLKKKGGPTAAGEDGREGEK